MTTTVEPASNGSIANKKSAPAQREHGMNRLREEECYHLTNLIGDSLGEAEYLVRKVHNKVYSRTLDQDGSKGTAPVDQAEAREILAEARDCAQVAIEYLCRATDALRDQDGQPF